MRKTRRRFVAAVGATLAIAGCQDGGGPTPEGSPGGAEDIGDEEATPMPGEGTPEDGGAVGTPTEEGMAEGTPTEEGMGEGTPTEEGMAEGTPTEEGMEEETPTDETGAGGGAGDDAGGDAGDEA